MKKLILITGLLVALSGLLRSVDAQTTSVVGYGSNAAGEIHLIDLETGISLSSFVASIDPVSGVGVALQGLAIDTFGTTLYGSDQNGLLYSIDIATETIELIGDTGLESIEAMDFNFNGTELWVTDFFSSPNPNIYSIDTSDASKTLVQTLRPGIGGDVRTMTADTTKDVLIANESFPIMEFQSVDTDIVNAPPKTNVTNIGVFDNDTNPFSFDEPKIAGMDRAIDGKLYGLSNDGGVYIIDQDPGLDETTTPRLSLIANTGGQAWLGLAIATATTKTVALDIKPNLCPNTLLINVVDDSDSIEGVKVAILGTSSFDVGLIDTTTLEINGIPPIASETLDVTAPTLLEPCNCEVLDPDGIVDLVLFFNKADLVGTLGTVVDLQEVPLTILGKLTNGVTEIEGTDCVQISTAASGGGDDEVCCDGNVTALTLKYTGSCAARIKVKQKGGTSRCGIKVFDNVLTPGSTFTINGANSEGSLGTEIRIYKGCRFNTKIHTSCSEPIGPGLVSGDFEVISGTSLNGVELCPLSAPDNGDAPAPAPDPEPSPAPGNGDDGNSDDEDCCKGKVKELTLKYTGSYTPYIAVYQKDGINVFNGMITSGDDTFTIVGADYDGTLSTEISIYVYGGLNTTIHTSCSTPIGPGLVSGDFEVISGTSLNGGALCPVNNDDNSNTDTVSTNSNDSGNSSGHNGYEKKRRKHRRKSRKSRQRRCRYNRGY